MRHSIEIGERKFKSKKEALIYYKTILNSYEFGQQLDHNDFSDILALLALHPKVEEKIGVGIKEVRIGKLKYNTRSFELVRLDDSTEFFSYTKRINAPRTNLTRFREACRQATNDDLRKVKQAYFDKYSKNGAVKCQETGELCTWTELSVDHRQPNTFSVIVERFIELNRIDIDKIKYIEIDGGPNEIADKELKENFRQYHKDKANLRIVKKDLNLSRAHQAKIARQKKDLTIE